MIIKYCYTAIIGNCEAEENFTKVVVGGLCFENYCESVLLTESNLMHWEDLKLPPRVP